MIGLDTNVLVRYIVRDEPAQAARVDRFVGTLTPEWPAYVSHIVLCELAWVLRRLYRFGQPTIADVIERVLETGVLRVEASALVWTALHHFRNSRADFADCLLALVNRRDGCANTVTFDKTAAALPGFQLL